MKAKDNIVARTQNPTLELIILFNIISSDSDYIKVGDKPGGIFHGYIAQHQKKKYKYIFKQCNKYYQQDNQLLNSERMGIIRELITSKIYKILLYDRAPSIGVVESNDNKINLSIQFFDHAETLATFSGDSRFMNAQNKVLKNLKGFEKVIAAAHVLGEEDHTAMNLMVKNNTVLKIDHGASATIIYKNLKHLIDYNYKLFVKEGYQEAISNGNLSFNIIKYSEALSYMLNILNKDQIDLVIDQMMMKLRTVGIDPKGLLDSTTNDLKQVNDYYKWHIMQNIENMSKISKQIKMLIKFGSQSSYFIEGGWLKACADICSVMKPDAKYNIILAEDGRNIVLLNNLENQSILNYSEEKHNRSIKWTLDANDLTLYSYEHNVDDQVLLIGKDTEL